MTEKEAKLANGGGGMAERKVPEVIDQEVIRREASSVLAAGDVSLTELWIEFFARGGMAGLEEFEAFVRGLMTVANTDLQILDLTMDELRNP
ncbi:MULTISPECIES: hypothetical protein [Paenarthrobacter]|uniref:Uncharacterized protein n=2 Tax=Micrococcaceae TaxID=1268 RepID=A0AAX3EKF0_PAEUR|nr:MULTISPECIES: hypothetical protein [Paenarthrobacter]MBN9128275.1 hypothetical protein [Paenarthrobacter ureafaciens]MDO5874207.1 hypothetical protein [Paenarthrobacter sp. SD-1]MEC3854158.1 hypothetical protein [Paenarthrobacter ureafaciens]QMU81178.1 hypothetical protein FV140_02685 [Paenarthrobacter ureafaciens]RWW95377.1 hypothetical protein AUR_12710 [Paenarthrobacter ureafaciens]